MLDLQDQTEERKDPYNSTNQQSMWKDLNHPKLARSALLILRNLLLKTRDHLLHLLKAKNGKERETRWLLNKRILQQLPGNRRS